MTAGNEGPWLIIKSKMRCSSSASVSFTRPARGAMERPASRPIFVPRVSGCPGSGSPVSCAAVACGRKDRVDSSEHRQRPPARGLPQPVEPRIRCPERKYRLGVRPDVHPDQRGLVVSGGHSRPAFTGSGRPCHGQPDASHPASRRPSDGGVRTDTAIWTAPPQRPWQPR